MQTRLAQSSDSELKANTDYPGSLNLGMPQASPSDTATGSSLHYFAHIAKVKFAHPTHLLTNNTNRVCLPPQQVLGKQM